MRILKATFAILIGLILVYIQLAESRPALCISAECLGFNIIWLLIFGLGVYALYRGWRMLFARERPSPESPQTRRTGMPFDG